MDTISKVWDKDAVQHLIATSDKALKRALWLIYQHQTAAEQSSLQTIEHNGRGFTGRDAEFLSDVARKLPIYNWNMTPRQIAKVRPMMKKYWRQILEEIEAKGGQVDKRRPKSEKAQSLNSEKATSPESEIAQSLDRSKANSLYGAFAM